MRIGLRPRRGKFVSKIQVIDGLRDMHCSNCGHTRVKSEFDVICSKGYRCARLSSEPDDTVTLSHPTRESFPWSFGCAARCTDWASMGPLGLTLAEELGLK